MRVIVCGGRDFGLIEEERNWIFDQLFEHLSIFDPTDNVMGNDYIPPDTTIINGGSKGVDMAAQDWAINNGLNYECYPAEWELYGSKAGPIRNQLMLNIGCDLVIAFPGGIGTWDMVKQARKAGVKVIKCSYQLMPKDSNGE